MDPLCGRRAGRGDAKGKEGGGKMEDEEFRFAKKSGTLELPTLPEEVDA